MTERLTGKQLERAAEILSQGGTVAFPTETVFGLGASCFLPHAIESVFRAKGRPTDNPLIVHLASADQLDALCDSVPEVAYRLIATWTPGPLTMVLKKKANVPYSVTAGLESVAIRFPSHPIARELLKLAKIPVAAPSANRSGRPSGTTWKSVLDDLDGQIDAIVCEDGCSVGVESTVVDLHCDPPRLLRPGAVSFSELQRLLPNIMAMTKEQTAEANSPGLRHRHYQPKARVEIVDRERLIDKAHLGNESTALIGITDCSDLHFALKVICTDVNEYAAKLFEFMREADRKGVNSIWCEQVSDEGVGAALMDRLRRASEPS